MSKDARYRIQRTSAQHPSLSAKRHSDQHAAPNEQYDCHVEEPWHRRLPRHHEHTERADGDSGVELRLVHRSQATDKSPREIRTEISAAIEDSRGFIEANGLDPTMLPDLMAGKDAGLSSW